MCHQLKCSLRMTVAQMFKTSFQHNYNLHAGDELPQLQSPWSVNDFINENGNIAKCLKIFCHQIWCQFTWTFCMPKSQKWSGTSHKSTQQWSQSFNRLNTFLISDQYVSSIKMLFENDSGTNVQNKFSTQPALWLLENEIAKRADRIVKKNKRKKWHQWK